MLGETSGKEAPVGCFSGRKADNNWQTKLAGLVEDDGERTLRRFPRPA